MNKPTQTDIPPTGYVVVKMPPNPFIDPLGPLYQKSHHQGILLGLQIGQRHCNPAGHCHGGMLTTLADMLLIFNANAQTGMNQFMVTVNLTCDFLAPANTGDWIEGSAEVTRASKNMIFVNGNLRVNSTIILRTNGIFKPTGIARPPQEQPLRKNSNDQIS